MTKELLEERIKALEQIKAGAMAQYQAAHGGIQDCLYWIEKLNPPLKALKRKGK